MAVRKTVKKSESKKPGPKKIVKKPTKRGIKAKKPVDSTIKKPKATAKKASEDEDADTRSGRIVPKIVGYEPAEIDGLGHLRTSAVFSSEAHLYKKIYPNPQAAIDAYKEKHKEST